MTNDFFSFKNTKPILAFIFVLSGATGLIYQVVWFKYLSLFLGNTNYAQMIVLSTFLGGLAWGNYFFGKRADSFANPVMWYGFLELLIGIYCIAYPLLNSFWGDTFHSFAISFDIYDNKFLFNLLRFGLSAILLIIPTFAMGGTLPILSKHFVREIKDSRKEMAILYFLNSFGAVGGVFLAGFILIKSIGLENSLYFSAAINIIIAIASIIISYKFVKPVSSELNNETDITQNQASTLPGISKAMGIVIIVVAGLSGLAALTYEMLWTRLLVNILGSSTYAFSIMLMAFISGITLGSIIVSQNFIGRFNRIKLLIFCQVAIVIGTMLVLPLYERLPYYLWVIASLFIKSTQTFPIFLTIEFMVTFGLMFVPTIFMGMTLPIAVEVLTHNSNRISFSIGKIFSINTFGTVAGAIMSGLLFIPFLGIKISFEIAMVINLFAALLLIFTYSKFSPAKKYSYLFLLIMLITGYSLLFKGWNTDSTLSGVFRKFNEMPPSSYTEFKNSFTNRNVLYYKEGVNSNVAVVEMTDSTKQRILLINGKPDASSIYDMPTQVLLGQIPMMLHPNPKNVFVVGFGSGVTIGSVLTHPVNSVTCVEISREVIDAAAYFSKENNSCLEDKRVNIVVEDAHTYLNLTKEKFDVIISEPSNPWIAGIGNLFSKEYFERCNNRLTDDGIMVQWFHIYELNDEILQLVLKTFNTVFPMAQIWNSVQGDLILVGTKKKMEIDYNLLRQKIAINSVKTNLNKIDINSVFTFLSCQQLSPEGFFSVASGSIINRESHPLLEFLAPKAFYLGETAFSIYNFDERLDTISNGLFIKEYYKLFPPTYDEIMKTANYHFKQTNNYSFSYALSSLLTENMQSYESKYLSILTEEKLNISSSNLFLLDELVASYPDSVQIVFDYHNALIEKKISQTSFLKVYDIKESADKLVKRLSGNTINVATNKIKIAKLYFQNSQFDQAFNICIEVDTMLTKEPNLGKSIPLDDYCYIYSLSSLYLGKYDMAFSYLVSLFTINNNYPLKDFLFRKIDWRTKY
jgi:spermidine synthase/MFS family permease